MSGYFDATVSRSASSSPWILLVKHDVAIAVLVFCSELQCCGKFVTWSGGNRSVLTEQRPKASLSMKLNA